LIKEAVQAHIKLNKLIFSDLDKIKDVVKVLGKSTAGIEFIRVPQPDLNFYSVLQTCPGLIGIFDKPKLPEVKPNSFDIEVICDNVREPSNLGALIRMANSLPAAKMTLPKGSVDPWDTKAIRGSCGSIFHLPVKNGLIWEEIWKNNENLDELVLIADNNVEYYDSKVVIDYDKISPELLFEKKITVIIGGETQGISGDALMYAKQKDYRVINIPIDSTANSLNVATALGIILFELRRLLTLMN
jgi:TrmH family RNA methyltransferase